MSFDKLRRVPQNGQQTHIEPGLLYARGVSGQCACVKVALSEKGGSLCCTVRIPFSYSRCKNFCEFANSNMSHTTVFRPLEWFAIRTKSNREAVVTEALSGRGLEAWYPRYSAGVSPRAVNKSVFPGYLFCRFNGMDRLPVLTVPGILNIVSNGKMPLPIDEREIESLRLVMESFLPVAPHEYFQIGDKVTITDGPLTGAHGYVVQRQCKQLIVCITLLQRAVSVVLEPKWLEKTCQAAA